MRASDGRRTAKIASAAALFATAAIVASPADAVVQKKFVYELSAAGLGAAEFHVVAQFADAEFRVDAWGQTYGAADLFESLTVQAFVTGTARDGIVTPSAFGTDNILNGDQRRTRVAWNGTEGVAEEVAPSLQDEERTPIPDDARMDAVDPISALMRFAYGPPAEGVCAGSVKVFDGRRSYTLSLDNADGNGLMEELEIGDTAVTALKCRIVSMRTGGKSPDSWLSSSKPQEAASIWFWRDGEGRAVPVRLEADAPIGHGVAQLAYLP